MFNINFRNSSIAEFKVTYINKAFDSDEKPSKIESNLQSNIQNETDTGNSGLFNQALLTCAIVLLACVS